MAANSHHCFSGFNLDPEITNLSLYILCISCNLFLIQVQIYCCNYPMHAAIGRRIAYCNVVYAGLTLGRELHWAG